MKGRKSTTGRGEHVGRSSKRSRRGPRVSSSSGGGALAEDELSAIVAAQFPDEPRRRRKKKTTRKSGGGRKKTAKKKPAKKKGAKKTRKTAVPEETEPAEKAAAEPFTAVAALADASEDPERAEQLWDDEVLGLLRDAAEGLAAEIEHATSAHAQALATRAEAKAAAEPPAVEREPAFLQLLPDDLDDEDAPLEVFDADALCDEMGVWDEGGSEEGAKTKDTPDARGAEAVTLPRTAARPAAATVPPDPGEWHAMVDYLATGREAARAARIARSLKRRAAATVLEFAPVHEQKREIALGQIAVVGILLAGWAATFYVRTGDLRVAVGMLSWASCVGCALALFPRPS